MASIDFHGIPIEEDDLEAWQNLFNQNPSSFPDYRPPALPAPVVPQPAAPQATTAPAITAAPPAPVQPQQVGSTAGSQPAAPQITQTSPQITASGQNGTETKMADTQPFQPMTDPLPGGSYNPNPNLNQPATGSAVNQTGALQGGYMYNDPSGYGSYWVNPGETPQQAVSRLQQSQNTWGLQPGPTAVPPTTPNAPLSPPGGGPDITAQQAPMMGTSGAATANDPNSIAAQIAAASGLDINNAAVQREANNQITMTGPNGTTFTGGAPGAYQPTTLNTAIKEAPTSTLDPGPATATPTAPTSVPNNYGNMDPNSIAAQLAALYPTQLPSSGNGTQGPVATQNPPYTPPPDDSTIDRSNYTQAPANSMTILNGGPLGYTNPDGSANTPTGVSSAPAGQPVPSPWAGLDLGDLPQIPNINLGQMPMMSGQFSPDFEHWYGSTAAAQAANIGNYWNPAGFPTAQAAQMNLGQIPQVNAQTPQQFQALQFLLSGQGFDPATIAKMKANATDTIGQQGIARMSAGRLAADRAGLGGSGYDAAIADEVARDNAAQQTQARNTIDIQNAQQGIQNLTAGAGMELGRQTSASQMANLVALQNASNLIQAMNTNVQNLQQANMTNFGGQQSRATNQAQSQTNALQNASNTWNTGAVDQNVQANQQNAANQQNWQLAQANMNNQNNQFNASTINNANANAMNNLVALTNGTSASTYSGLGNQPIINVNTNNPYAAVLSGYSTGIANQANR